MDTFNRYWDSIMVNSPIDFIFTIFFWIVALASINKVINIFLNKHNIALDKPKKRIKKIVFITVIVLVVGFQFKVMSDVLTALLASGGLIAIIVGLACQEAASNLIAGAMIYLTHPYTVGDQIYLKEKDIRGTVVDITFRQTVIQTFNNTSLIIPNTVMNNSIIENVSRINETNASFLYVSISYDDDIDKAIKIIQDIVLKHPAFVNIYDDENADIDQLVPVLVTNFLDSGIELRTTVYTKDSGSGFVACSDLRKRIKETFDKNGITIPYPTYNIKK